VRRFGWALCALAMIALIAGCQSTDNGAAFQAAPDNPQIFRVGGDSYTLADYHGRLDAEIRQGIAQLLQQGQTREQIEELANQNNIRGAIFDRMIQDALLMRHARQSGIGVDPAAIDSAVLAQAAPFDTASPFPDTTALRASQAQNQLVLKMLAQNTRADMLHARHILLDSEAAADQTLADLGSGVDFGRLAEERSQDSSSADDGGDLGWVPRGDLPPELEAAAYSLPLNTPTKVQAGASWHIIEVLERQAGETLAEKRPFDSFEQLQGSANGQQYYQETFVPWYDQLRKDAEVSGELAIAQGFDPNSIPLPFPEEQ
jgi:peptidyl-prolyl cis-trans isomerase C